MKVSVFNFKGACCANGIIRAKKAVAVVAGAGKVSIDLANDLALVEGEANPDAIIKALTDEGFEASFNQTTTA